MEKILRSLTPKFEHVVVAIEEANEISTMIVRLLFGSLRVLEQQMNDNRLKNQLNRLYKHKPQLVAPIINMVVHEAKDVVVIKE